MKYLEEKKIGFNTGAARVPIVPAAILYDLNLGRADVRPDSAMGYLAASRATSSAPAEGNVGVGTGASVGKMFGASLAMKAGVGTVSLHVGGGVIVGALVAVNAFGDIDRSAYWANYHGSSFGQGGSVARGRKRVNLPIRSL
jgi:L-aminopeptidase/D-esterase-like protein